MPNKAAAAKAWRQNTKAKARNTVVKGQVKKSIKAARQVLGNKEKEKAIAAVKAAIKALDRAAQKKVVKKNAAARKKSRLVKKLNSL
jgi:small subunit ribosomal protein S20